MRVECSKHWTIAAVIYIHTICVCLCVGEEGKEWREGGEGGEAKRVRGKGRGGGGREGMQVVLPNF